MKENSKKSTLSFLIPILIAIFLAKAFWVSILYLYLPKSGIDKSNIKKIEPLFYRYTLASKKEAPKPIIKKKKINKVKIIKKPKNLEIKKFILRGIYYASDKKITTLEYLGKTYILEVGESVKGFKVTKIMPKFVIFKKDNQEYRLDIFKEDNKTLKSNTSNNMKLNTPKIVTPKEQKDIIREGDTTYISKRIFNKYKRDINGLRRYIGGVPIIKNGKLRGFRITYIKRGSDFDKIGLQRGDIITAINGEEITDLSVPMSFIKNIDSIRAATITVKRGNEEKELEYEVQ